MDETLPFASCFGSATGSWPCRVRMRPSCLYVWFDVYLLRCYVLLFILCADFSLVYVWALVNFMCGSQFVLCAGCHLYYVRFLVCVMCSLQPRPPQARGGHFAPVGLASRATCPPPGSFGLIINEVELCRHQAQAWWYRWYHPP